jgi:HSP20 family protein
MTFVTGRPVFAKKTFAPFHQVVNNLADEFLNRSIADFIGNDTLHAQPSVNIIDAEAAYVIEIAAPGLQKEAFKIELEKNQLIVSVEKSKADDTEKAVKYTRREFTFASFKRSFQLPENIAIEHIGAQYEQGILILTLPQKAVEVPANKHITVV